MDLRLLVTFLSVFHVCTKAQLLPFPTPDYSAPAPANAPNTSIEPGPSPPTGPPTPPPPTRPYQSPAPAPDTPSPPPIMTPVPPLEPPVHPPLASPAPPTASMPAPPTPAPPTTAPPTPKPTTPPSSMVKLAGDLLNEDRYKPYIIPVMDPENGITVNISFTLYKVQSLEETSQTLISSGYLDMKWYDELLRWDPDAYNGLTSIVLSPDQVWMPEIIVLNSMTQQEDIALSESMRFRVHVTYYGRVTWTPAQKWETFCRANMAFFPFDTQTCEVQIVNFINQQGSEVKLQLASTQVHLPLGLNAATTGEWHLREAEASQGSLILDESTQEWYRRPVISMSLRIERVSEFYIFNVILPIVIITQVSSLGYLLPCASGEKISFSITILLTYFVLLLMVSELMPRAGQEMPYITTYVTLCMFMNSFSLLFTIIILNFYHHHPYSRVPSCLRAVFFRCCGKILCCSVPTKAELAAVGSKKKIIIDHKMVADPATIHLDSVNGSTSRAADTSDYANQRTSEAGSVKSAPPVQTVVVEEEDDEKAIQERNQEEWIQLATVIDRLLFISTSVTITCITIFYFLVVKVLSLSYGDLFQSMTTFSL